MRFKYKEPHGLIIKDKNKKFTISKKQIREYIKDQFYSGRSHLIQEINKLLKSESLDSMNGFELKYLDEDVLEKLK
jgi:hypothetical protein